MDLTIPARFFKAIGSLDAVQAGKLLRALVEYAGHADFYNDHLPKTPLAVTEIFALIVGAQNGQVSHDGV